MTDENRMVTGRYIYDSLYHLINSSHSMFANNDNAIKKSTIVANLSINPSYLTSYDDNQLVPRYKLVAQAGFTAYSELVHISKNYNDDSVFISGNFNAYKNVPINNFIKLTSSGSIDTSFNIGTGFNNTTTFSVVQSDGKIIVGGYFTTYDGLSYNRLIRLNPDGSIDTSFNIGTGFNNAPMTAVIQPDGKIIVGGIFTTYNNSTYNRLIRLNSNGSIDTSFNIGSGITSPTLSVSDIVHEIALQPDGKIIIVGSFQKFNGYNVYGYTRINTNGSRDTSMATNTTWAGEITDVVINSDGTIILIGHMTDFANNPNRNYIVKLSANGVIDNTFNSIANPSALPFNYTGNTNNSRGALYCIKKLSNNNLIVSGAFTSYSGNDYSSFIVINTSGAVVPSFSSPNYNEYIMITSSVVLSDGSIISVGKFQTFRNQTKNGIVKLLSDGSIDPTFN